MDEEPGLVVGYLREGELRAEGGVYTRPPTPWVNQDAQGPIVGFRVGRVFHGLLTGGMHTPENAS